MRHEDFLKDHVNTFEGRRFAGCSRWCSCPRPLCFLFCRSLPRPCTRVRSRTELSCTACCPRPTSSSPSLDSNGTIVKYIRENFDEVSVLFIDDFWWPDYNKNSWYLDEYDMTWRYQSCRLKSLPNSLGKGEKLTYSKPNLRKDLWGLMDPSFEWFLQYSSQ